MMKEKITAVIMTFNSCEYVQSAINSLLWCKEIIIIDDYSDDNIIAVANKNKIKLYKYHTHNDFSRARNYALGKAKFEWILFIDSDEFVTDSLKNEISQNIKNDLFDGYFLHRIDSWKGVYMQNKSKEVHKYGDNGNTYLIRLGRKNAGRWIGKVHEKWLIDGNVGKIESNLLHFPHKTVELFVDHIDKYSKIHSQEKKNTNNIYLKILFFPLFKFLYMFFYLGGYKNGIQGLIYAGMMSLHSFLSWTRLWFIKTGKIKYI